MKNSIVAIALSLASASSFATTWAPGHRPVVTASPETLPVVPASPESLVVCGILVQSPVGGLLLNTDNNRYLLVSDDQEVQAALLNLKAYDVVCASSSEEPGFGIESAVLHVDSFEKKGNAAAQ